MDSFIPYPSVSIIMPVRNEALYIAQSLGAVLRQDYPPELLEIIVVDGQSDDNTVALIQALPGAGHVCILSNTHKIQAAGLNQAIRIASGQVIVRVDGHTIITPDHVRHCVEALTITQASNVGGSIHYVAKTTTGRAIGLASCSRFAVPTAFRVSRRSQYADTVYMGAWPRQVFAEVGLFDEGFVVNEDYELNFRIRRAGGLIYFSSEICSEYYGQETLFALAKQYFRYGTSKPKTLLKHPRSLRIRHLVAPIFVAFIIGGALLSILLPQVRSAWVCGIILYLLANIVFSIHVGLREKLSILVR
ncbi:MAG: glycosyltransferase family 2 protein, partial [Chloroflexota bacterium]